MRYTSKSERAGEKLFSLEKETGFRDEKFLDHLDEIASPSLSQVRQGEVVSPVVYHVRTMFRLSPSL